jgi:hypothetical protein
MAGVLIHEWEKDPNKCNIENERLFFRYVRDVCGGLFLCNRASLAKLECTLWDVPFDPTYQNGFIEYELYNSRSRPTSIKKKKIQISHIL